MMGTDSGLYSDQAGWHVGEPCLLVDRQGVDPATRPADRADAFAREL